MVEQGYIQVWKIILYPIGEHPDARAMVATSTNRHKLEEWYTSNLDSDNNFVEGSVLSPFEPVRNIKICQDYENLGLTYDWVTPNRLEKYQSRTLIVQ
jgi:hypothetical protein